MIVFFGGESSSDWGLKLYDFQISPPEPQTVYVDVPFRDGTLDFSTALTDGVVHYKNRTITMGFDLLGDWSKWLEATSKINNSLLGKKLQIRTELELEYYYLGRCMISNLKDSFALGSITITATCDPYKYKLSPTVREYDVKGTLSIGPLNGRMPTVPTVTTDAEITVKFNGSTIVFPPGTRKDPSLLFVEGYNHMELTGTGHIKFEYQEGEL